MPLRQHLDLMLDNALGATPRLALAAVAQLKLDIDFLEGRAVALARREGYDWGRIGRLLVISRQAARQRWAKLDVGMMMPSTQMRSYRDPIAEDRATNTRDSNWRAEVRRLEEGGEAVAW